jgi:N-acetyl-gamma-glutamylphosphate reductase
MKTKVILTGATGMVGEGVLLECLAHPDVEKVLIRYNRLRKIILRAKTDTCFQKYFK